ncbi:MAG: glycosyltransferase [Armatimonadaceae bacterium]
MKDNPLRILFVLPYVPSPIRVRPYQILRALTDAGHRVTVVALDTDDTPTPDTELDSRCDAVYRIPHSRPLAMRNCLRSLPTRTPLWAAYCHSPAMYRQVHELAKSGNFDVAHVEHLRAAHFASALDPLPRLIDAVDCITELQRQVAELGAISAQKRLLARLEWQKLRDYEPQAYRAFDQIMVTSRHDASALRELAEDRGIHLPPLGVIGNGVDTAYFSPDPDRVPSPKSLVFSGKLSYVANDDAARFLLREILPCLRRRCPEAHLILAGSGPSKAVQTLVRRIGGVTVTGYTDDLRPHIRQASVAVAPLRIAVGVQNKVLEAMALQKPVVLTTLAVRSLTDAVRERALFVGETATQYAEICARLLENPAEAQASGEAARQYVAERHRWQVSAEQFVERYRMVLSKAQTATLRATGTSRRTNDE